ncbi:SidA/IucD/PvdA family monooxygenase [Pseudomonas sp. nanlin1]|uniref:SidA/IucD/PvdA family monooxygenase n=1 Tax=Pseudomonas sp. nanlin1 TaxID=3040605 RepID=UPI00388F49C7
MHPVYDVIGIGFGPANIALAIAMEEKGLYPNSLFLEKAANPVWQGEMLFEISLDTYSNIQNIPFRDLVTPRNPRSRYTFLNYLHENGLFFEHLNMDMLMPMRPDYARYIAWVVDLLRERLRTSCDVQHIERWPQAEGPDLYRVSCADGSVYHARHLVLGTGRSPRLPELFSGLHSERVFHQSRYNTALANLQRHAPKRIAVVGSSQSAVEIIMHLSKTLPDTQIHSIIRRYAYPLKDTSPFMSEIFFPTFTDAYYNADQATKARIDADAFRTNYGACDMDILEELYKQMYYDKLHGRQQIHLHRLTDIQSVNVDEQGVDLRLFDQMTQLPSDVRFDAVVLATGFTNLGQDGQQSLPLLHDLEASLQRSATGAMQIGRDYRVRLNAPTEQGAVVLNGLCESSHGMGDGGSLSLVSLRADSILAGLQAHDQLAHSAPAPLQEVALDA